MVMWHDNVNDSKKSQCRPSQYPPCCETHLVLANSLVPPGLQLGGSATAKRTNQACAGIEPDIFTYDNWMIFQAYFHFKNKLNTLLKDISEYRYRSS